MIEDLTTAGADQHGLLLVTPSNETTRPEAPCQWITDGASRMGKVRSENQDAFRLLRIDANTACLILCDGAGGVEGGKLAAELTASVIETQLQKLIAGRGVIDPTVLEAAISTARRAITKASEAGITTVIIALLQGEHLHYATLGDGALTIFWPDGMILQALVPHHLLGQPSNIIAAYVGDDCATPPRTGSIRLEPGCTVMAMSDGASDLFPYEVFAENRHDYAERLVSERGDSALADVFLAQLEAARDPDTGAYLHHDNMTLLMAHLSRAKGDDDDG